MRPLHILVNGLEINPWDNHVRKDMTSGNINQGEYRGNGFPVHAMKARDGM